MITRKMLTMTMKPNSERVGADGRSSKRYVHGAMCSPGAAYSELSSMAAHALVTVANVALVVCKETFL